MFQTILNGLLLGLVYALLAAGFSLILGAARVLFFAHGEIYMLGAVVVYLLISKSGLPYPAAIILGALSIGLLGVIIERGLFRRFRGHGLPFAIATLALGMILSNSALLTFGERTRGLPSPFAGNIELFGASLTVERLVIMVVSVAIILGLYFFLQRTRPGRAIRAVSQDEEAAASLGIDINHTTRLTFFIATAVGAAAGGLILPVYSVSSYMGSTVFILTLMVVILGGLGSFPGAIIGGLVLGITQSLLYTYIGAQTVVFLFLIVIVMIIIRPRGILGGRA